MGSIEKFPLHAARNITIVSVMGPGESTPWKPEPLDSLLDEPFEKMEEQRRDIFLQRLDALREELDTMEAELDQMLQETAHCS
jgi:hypothetical protein